MTESRISDGEILPVAVVGPGPAGLITSFYTDCLARDLDVVDLAVGVFGADRMVLGSDWPFAMGSDGTVALLSHREVGLVRQVDEENARTLLGRSRERWAGLDPHP